MELSNHFWLLITRNNKILLRKKKREFSIISADTMISPLEHFLNYKVRYLKPVTPTCKIALWAWRSLTNHILSITIKYQPHFYHSTTYPCSLLLSSAMLDLHLDCAAMGNHIAQSLTPPASLTQIGKIKWIYQGLQRS